MVDILDFEKIKMHSKCPSSYQIYAVVKKEKNIKII